MGLFAIEAVQETLPKLTRLVDSSFSTMSGFANDAVTKINEMTGEMSALTFPDIPPPPTLNPPSNAVVIPAPGVLPSPAVNAFVPPPAPDALEIDVSFDLGDLSIPDAPPTIPINLPDAPAKMAIGAVPEKPAVDTNIEMPPVPSIILPELGDMVKITVPDFTFPTLPTFEETAPTADFPVPNPIMGWAEPDYASEILPDILARVREMLAGGTGLPAVVEQALFDRARQREDQASQTAIATAFETFAAKGFSLPPGALLKQVNVVSEQSRFKLSEINRDILTEAAKMEIENLRFAVEKGIALEGLLENIFENMAKRAFEVAKYQAESQIAVFNSQVSLFNAKMQGYQTLSTVYRAQIEAVNAQVQAYKTAVDAQVALGSVNEQTIKAYSAEIQGALSVVELYKAQMSGVQTKADVVKSIFEGYRTEIQAYAETINAEKTVFDAYKVQVDGEAAKANIMEAQTRAYAATIQGIGTQADIKTKGAQLKIEAARAKVSAYEGQVTGYKANIDAALAQSNYAMNTFKMQADAFTASVQNQTSVTEAQIRVMDADMRTNIAYSEMQIKEYEAKISQGLKMAEIASDAMKSAGMVQAQIASGAMSAMHVSAGVSSSANAGMSAGYTESHSYEEKKLIPV